MTQPTKGSQPVCWFCKIPIGLDATTRATAPTHLGLPSEVGVIICTPACPELPEDAIAWRHPDRRRTA